MHIVRLVLVLVSLGVSASAQWFELQDKLHRMDAGAFSAVQMKAEQGDADAQLLVAAAYRFGIQVPKDVPQFMAWTRRAAESRNPEAQFTLAMMYGNGKLTGTRDVENMIVWLRRAAENGHPVAQHNLGTHYLDGEGVPRDPVEGERWLKLSAEQGFTHAQYILGRAYLKGEQGIALNPDAGEQWIRKAAEKGHGGALVVLAQLYSGPDFVPRDPALVETLLLRAAEMKIVQAQYQIARMYRLGFLRAPEYARAIEWFEEAAEKKYAPAHVALAEMYAKGEGTPVDLPRSASLYRTAAELGYAPGIMKTAENYRYGRGTAPDPISAAMWLMIAAQKGIPDAQPALDAVEKELKPAQVASARQRADSWIAGNAAAMAQPVQGFNLHRMIPVPNESPADRPPSTPEERERAVKLVAELEANLLGPEGDASRQWLDKWMAEIPDIFFHSCPLLEKEKDEVFPYHLYLVKQAYYEGGAYLIQHPEKVNDQLTIYIAGVEGALRAYNNVIAKSPTKRNPSLDLLLKTQADGQLGSLIHERVRERCR